MSTHNMPIVTLSESQYADASAMLARGRMLSVVARQFDITPARLSAHLCHAGMVSRRLRTDRLSPRQRQIWDLHQGGMHRYQIADQLGLRDASVAGDLTRSRNRLA